MSYDDFVKWLDNLDVATVNANPIPFKLSDFEEHDDFTKSMFLAGRFFSSSEDIVVRYSKPYTEDKTEVIVQFNIVRSKAKMFYNYIKNSEKDITCFLTTNKEIKECIKFFNSLAVKGEDMVSLSSKELDYTSMLKDEFDEYNKRRVELGKDIANAILITITNVHDFEIEIDYPLLRYGFLSNFEGDGDFKEIKAWVKSEILKIKE